MQKMIWYCHHCGTVLQLWKIKCPNCHRSALSVLQVAVVAMVAVPALFLLLHFL
jgi:Zn finger protein HypA/HybF involved in hydrogenase expression